MFCSFICWVLEKLISLGKYLGVPLTGRAPKKEDYQYIIEQVWFQAHVMESQPLVFCWEGDFGKVF